jgi:hypothetical protein
MALKKLYGISFQAISFNAGKKRPEIIRIAHGAEIAKKVCVYRVQAYSIFVKLRVKTVFASLRKTLHGCNAQHQQDK